MGDDSIDTVILDIDVGYLVTLFAGPAVLALSVPLTFMLSALM